MALRHCTPLVIAALALAGCSSARPGTAPQVEFVLTTADSAFWVTSDRTGVHVRGVPMVLARADGGFREVYVADDDRSFYDAVFVGQRMFARDITRGDSTELFADTVVTRLARQYAAANPDEAPLAAEEQASQHPRTTATADVEVLDVHGPYVSFEYHSDLDFTGEHGKSDRHAVRRGVVDMRTGQMAALAALFGAEAAGRATAAASREWEMARDSLLERLDASGRRARRDIGAYAFDATSFSLTAIDGAPRVVFAVPGDARRGPVQALELTPQAVGAPLWWRDVKDELPAGPDALRRWSRGRVSVVARLDSAGDRARVTLRDSGGGEWPVSVVVAPVKKVLWLDAGVGADTRRALRRAFNEASAYSDETRIAAAPRRGLAMTRAIAVARPHSRRARGLRTSSG